MMTRAQPPPARITAVAPPVPRTRWDFLVLLGLALLFGSALAAP